MNLYLHIGTEKTGSTSIQFFLHKNREQLKKYGYHYIECTNDIHHQELASYFRTTGRGDDFFSNKNILSTEGVDAYKAKTLEKLNKELKSLPDHIHSLIISSEHFHSRTTEVSEIKKIKEYFSKVCSEIKIICYLRSQSSMVTSFYSTVLKSGQSKSFNDIVTQCHPNNYYYNFKKLLSNWEEVFGRDALEINLFSSEKFFQQDLLDDFLSKVDHELIGKLNKNTDKKNNSINYSGQLLLRALNLAGIKKFINPECKPKAIIFRECLGQGQQLNKNQLSRIKESFKKTNEDIREKYFPEMKSLFDQDSVDLSLNRIDAQKFFMTLKVLLTELSLNDAITIKFYHKFFNHLQKFMNYVHVPLAHELSKIVELFHRNNLNKEKKLSLCFKLIEAKDFGKNQFYKPRQLFEEIHQIHKKAYGKTSTIFNKAEFDKVEFSDFEEERIAHYLGDLAHEDKLEVIKKKEGALKDNFVNVIAGALNEDLTLSDITPFMHAYFALPRFYSEKFFNYNFGDASDFKVTKNYLSKSREVNNSTISLLNTPVIQHWGHVQDIKEYELEFEKKKDLAVWRGTTTGHPHDGKQRSLLVKNYQGNKKFDVGYSKIVQNKTQFKKYLKNKLSIREMNEYKYIICLEGKDIASGLSWGLKSNSVVLMPPPRYTSWLTVEMLKAYDHYIPLETDLSDLEEKLDWAMNHQEQCKDISAKATQFIDKYLDIDREIAIEIEVIKRYLDALND